MDARLHLCWLVGASSPSLVLVGHERPDFNRRVNNHYLNDWDTGIKMKYPTYIFSDFVNSLRTLVDVLRVPASFSKIDNILFYQLACYAPHHMCRKRGLGKTHHKHELMSARNIRRLKNIVDTAKVRIHHAPALLRVVKRHTDCS